MYHTSWDQERTPAQNTREDLPKSRLKISEVWYEELQALHCDEFLQTLVVNIDAEFARMTVHGKDKR